MDTKKFILLTMLLTIVFSCGSGDRGELVGTKGKKLALRKALWDDLNTRWFVYNG